MQEGGGGGREGKGGTEPSSAQGRIGIAGRQWVTGRGRKAGD